MKLDNSSPLYHAKRELRLAEKALQRMREAESLEDFEDEWKIFLNAIEKVWVKAERSCQHIRNKFQPIQGRYSRERKKDPVLKYLKHARNCDQHTVSVCMSKEEASRTIEIDNPNKAVSINSLVIKNGVIEECRGNFEMVVIDLPDRIELLRIKDSGKWYNPPKSHKGVHYFHLTPLEVGGLGVKYYYDFLNEIEKALFQP